MMKRKLFSIVLCVAVALSMSLTACGENRRAEEDALTNAEYASYLSYGKYANSTVTVTCEETKEGVETDTHRKEIYNEVYMFSDTAQYMLLEEEYEDTGTWESGTWSDSHTNSSETYTWVTDGQVYGVKRDDGAKWENYDPQEWWDENDDWESYNEALFAERFVLLTEYDYTFFQKTADGFALKNDRAIEYATRYFDTEDFVIHTVDLRVTAENGLINSLTYTGKWTKGNVTETITFLAEVTDVGTTLVSVPQATKFKGK